MQATNRPRKFHAAQSIVLFAAMLVGTGTMQAPPIGVPAGEHQDGVMVKRLPSIAVTVRRGKTVARVAQEESWQ